MARFSGTGGATLHTNACMRMPPCPRPGCYKFYMGWRPRRPAQRSERTARSRPHVPRLVVLVVPSALVTVVVPALAPSVRVLVHRLRRRRPPRRIAPRLEDMLLDLVELDLVPHRRKHNGAVAAPAGTRGAGRGLGTRICKAPARIRSQPPQSGLERDPWQSKMACRAFPPNHLGGRNVACRAFSPKRPGIRNVACRAFPPNRPLTCERRRAP